MAYPVNLELDAPDKVANWRPLVHWLLVIPQAIVAYALGYALGAVGIVSWFIILFTGKLPEGIANFQCMVLRYQWRVNSYAYFLREKYPPFEFPMTGPDPHTDPMQVDFQPQLEDRNRLTCGLRFLWAIPILIFAAIIAFGAAIIIFISVFVVLFTGKWQEGMRRFVLQSMRLLLRAEAYAYLLRDDYPPFALQ
jgi:hypothetical protein